MFIRHVLPATNFPVNKTALPFRTAQLLSSYRTPQSMKRLYSQVSTTSGATAMAEEREIQTPLLQNSPSSSTSEIQRHIEDEILPFSPSEVPESEPHDVITSSSSVARKNQRLVSLDVFRGLTIAVCFLLNFIIFF